MRHIKQKIRGTSENLHMLIHLCFGFLASIVVHYLFPDISFGKILLVASLGSVLPDLDHFLYMFWYGSSTPFSRVAKQHLKNRDIKSFLIFCKSNHKNNTQLYSHNLLVLAATTALFWRAERRDMVLSTVLYLSWCLHYLFDMVEDALFFGIVNPNWMLKFKKESSELNKPGS